MARPPRFDNVGILGDVPNDPNALYICHRLGWAPHAVPGEAGACADCGAAVHMSDPDRAARVLTVVCIECAAKRHGMTPDAFLREADRQMRRRLGR